MQIFSLLFLCSLSCSNRDRPDLGQTIGRLQDVSVDEFVVDPTCEIEATEVSDMAIFSIGIRSNVKCLEDHVGTHEISVHLKQLWMLDGSCKDDHGAVWFLTVSASEDEVTFGRRSGEHLHRDVENVGRSIKFFDDMRFGIGSCDVPLFLKIDVENDISQTVRSSFGGDGCLRDTKRGSRSRGRRIAGNVEVSLDDLDVGVLGVELFPVGGVLQEESAEALGGNVEF